MSLTNCKNCSQEIADSDKFCAQCGGKIIRERITFKTLISDAFWRAIGWDNKYLKTVRHLIIKPQVILSGYISGVRKRYVNPIAFFAIGMTISLITFNVFQDHYLELSGVGDVQIDKNFQLPDEPVISFGTGAAPTETIEAIETQRQIAAYIQKSILKYFNIYSFALLPLYTFVAFLVFRKKNNFTEHLIINAYLQGTLFLYTTLFFLLTLFALEGLYYYAALFGVFYYTYAYGRLYKLGFWKSILYLLKFVGVSLVLIILLGVLGIGIGYAYAVSQG
ncbi:MAG: DUF3667 domain-containing protein [Crocinitomix sp.]|nr:DUF3667 domain-containing protein [Crocinitomix sp.]